MNMNRVVIAIAFASSIGASGFAFADVGTSSAAPISLATAPAQLGNAFGSARAIAVNKLSGAVSNVSVQSLGNGISVTGSGNGGAGGSANGGTGNGGSGTGGSSNGSGGGAAAGTGDASGSANGQGNGASGSGGGVGAAGAAGASHNLNAGSLNLSNNISGLATSAAGIVIVSQNSGVGALTQQSVNVQANMSAGK